MDARRHRSTAEPEAWGAEAELASLVRRETASKLRLGALLHAFRGLGGHHELGFSSMQAYLVERVGRSVRWCEDVQRMVRRLRDGGCRRLERALVEAGSPGA